MISYEKLLTFYFFWLPAEMRSGEKRGKGGATSASEMMMMWMRRMMRMMRMIA